jgi:hypothetical protein
VRDYLNATELDENGPAWYLLHGALANSSFVVERLDNIPAEPPDRSNVTGLRWEDKLGLDQLDAPGGPRAPMCGTMFPPGQFAVQQCTLPKGHIGEHEHKSIGL